MASKITVGKIVANATDNAWSQAYHAGGFTAVVSVSAKEDQTEEKHLTLQAAGKQLLDTLVSEYFTLTTKDLETIKNAVTTTIEKAPQSVTSALIVAACVKNVLYVVIAHEGRVLLKRGDKLGMLLEVSPASDVISSISGFLEPHDIVLLHTTGFGKIFTHDELVETFEGKSAEDLAEVFAPKVHGAQDGSASALVFSYQEDEQPALKEPLPMVEERKVEPVASDLPGFEKAPPGVGTSTTPSSFSHRQRLFLTVTIILALVLIGSIALFQYRQTQAKQQALFTSVFQPAQQKFTDAQGLLDLNKTLAIQDLQEAQQELTNAKGQFPANSSEEKQILALLTQVNTTLDSAKKVPVVSATKAPDNASSLLSFATNHSSGYVSQDDTNFYSADSTAITQYNKKTNASKKIITADWKSIGGFGTYLGNMYVLDTQSGILKYAGTDSGFGNKTSYFASGVNPDVSKAVSITIDGSIWILTSDGAIAKYTKGTQDSLTVSGLDTPLKNPTQILTSVDMSNVYILDKGNGRVVVLKKDGSFVAQYASDTVHTTSLIDVSETNKKIYLLSSGTVYQLDLK